MSRRKGQFLTLSENPAELNHGNKRIFLGEGQPYRHQECELLCTLFYCIDNKMVLNEYATCVDLREMAECLKWQNDGKYLGIATIVFQERSNLKNLHHFIHWPRRLS